MIMNAQEGAEAAAAGGFAAKRLPGVGADAVDGVVPPKRLPAEGVADGAAVLPNRLPALPVATGVTAGFAPKREPPGGAVPVAGVVVFAPPNIPMLLLPAVGAAPNKPGPAGLAELKRSVTYQKMNKELASKQVCSRCWCCTGSKKIRRSGGWGVSGRRWSTKHVCRSRTSRVAKETARGWCSA